MKPKKKVEETVAQTVEEVQVEEGLVALQSKREKYASTDMGVQPGQGKKKRRRRKKN